MAHLKGSMTRLIETPGYHIRPKYDLPALRERLDKRKQKKPNFDLSLTAMIDMFSTLVVFLLLNFSSTGEAFFVSKNVKIPEAKHARPLESLPVISITKDGVSLDAQKVGDNPVAFTTRDWDMPGLSAALRNLRDLQLRFARAGVGTEAKAQINVQADQNVEVLHIKRVMNTLISEGFTGINFAVREID